MVWAQAACQWWPPRAAGFLVQILHRLIRTAQSLAVMKVASGASYTSLKQLFLQLKFNLCEICENIAEISFDALNADLIEVTW